MSNLAVTIDGLEEARRALQNLDDKMQRKTLVQVFRKAGRPIAVSARSNVRGISKRVAQSIYPWEARRAQNPMVFVGPKYSKNPAKDPWFAHMIEGGTKGEKKSAGGKRLPYSTDGRLIYIRKLLKKGKKGTTYRRDMPARPFMAPAFEQNQAKAGEIIVQEVSKIIDNAVK